MIHEIECMLLNILKEIYRLQLPADHQTKGYLERSSFDTGRLLGTGGSGARGGGGN